ncbi:methenyltetrahydrofolate synthase domain-containing protein [Culex pipiens pallens]|uniref:methenyltetrahydrofolate synthase domain-containing protein n=1 Tax=Culex pipiens pallens TaxID=42434 RepID=UPI00195471B9|nr:methenyltetrahydrofolate synthase domain-containing protein [Culex pipiens pallens]XP_039450092.1 methenyltetrahydrofolate synthase domain-containing protein [Culex pipiens pallens]
MAEDQSETVAAAATATAPAAAPESPLPPVEDKPKEITKRTFRLETWQKIKEQKLSPVRRFNSFGMFNKIPYLVGVDKAAELLAETDEFKKANSIKVNIDLAQEQVKLEVIKAGKTLLVPPSHKSANVYAKIKAPADTAELDLAAQKKLIKLQAAEDTFDEIDINSTEKIDMVVVGSYAVDRQGRRIGKGNGYVDLDVGILTHLGCLTKDTLIVTTVHDVQVYDALPENLFQSYDLPLDLIVTPTEVIRVGKRLGRPAGIEWNLLSSRRLEIVPVLKSIKEKLEGEGKVVELKSEDTDVESYRQKARRRSFRGGKEPGQRRRRRSDRRTSEKQQNGGGGESHDEGGERTDGEAGEGGKQRRRPRRPNRRLRRSGKGEGESGAEKSEAEGGDGGDGDGKKVGGRGERRRREPKPRSERKGKSDWDLCIRVSNINRSMRIKELKQVLRVRDLNPMFIKWNGFHGKCYLHFPKKPDMNDDDAGAELLKQLENLTVTVTPREKDGGGEPKEVTLTCELMKRKEGGGAADTPATNGTVLEGSRIETTDVTAV